MHGQRTGVVKFATPVFDVFLHDLTVLASASEELGKHFAIVLLVVVFVRVGASVRGATVDS